MAKGWNAKCEFKPTQSGAGLTDAIRIAAHNIGKNAVIAMGGTIHSVSIEESIVIDGKLFIGTSPTIEALGEESNGRTS